MARIKTTRPEAMRYQGAEATFVRDVTEGPAFNKDVDQVIVTIGDEELYFFANEVTLSDAEKTKADKARGKAKEESEQSAKDAAERFQNKMESFAQYRAGAEPVKDEDKPIAGTGGIAPMDIPAHRRSTPAQVADGTNKFNPVPGSPPKAEEPATATGKEGLPLGSGSDPQGRREDAKDQSKSNPSERPVPGAQAPQEPQK